MLNAYVIRIYEFREKDNSRCDFFMSKVLRINRYIYSLGKGKFFVQQFV